MLNDLVRDILSHSGLSRPDGRMLHSYGLSDAEIAAIEVALRCATLHQSRQVAMAGLYVLWAAERIRRHYDGGGLSWAFVNAPVPGIFQGATREGIVRRGLDFWQRPLRQGSGRTRLFLYSLLAEGGLPLAVLEGARQHVQVLRDMIEEIAGRGGVTALGVETAQQLARARMHYLPQILKNDDTIALFVDLAQAIFDLSAALPPGLPTDRIVEYLDTARPGWQHGLPLRVTPQIIENIIRPSLAARSDRPRVTTLPALREIQLDDAGQAFAFAVLAAKAGLPLAALPGDGSSMLRLLPRFSSRRPLAYRALPLNDLGQWELDRIGANGPERLPLGLYQALEFDVMADSHAFDSWTALPPMPPADEAISFWAGTVEGPTGQRLRALSGGRTRSPTIWAALPPGETPELEGDLMLARRVALDGTDLVELRGQGRVICGAQRLSVATGADADSEAAALVLLGQVLPGWRTSGGDVVYLGRPRVHGQRSDGPLHPLAAGQLRRCPAHGRSLGAEICEWWEDGERLAVARAVSLPATLRIEMREMPEGGLSLRLTGLSDGMLIDVRAGAHTAHGKGPHTALTLPPRLPEAAGVALTVTEIETGRNLELHAPWPVTQPLFLRDGKALPGHGSDIAVDTLPAISYLAPGPRCRLGIRMGNGERRLDLPVAGTAPLIRHQELLRKLLAQGTSDQRLSLVLENAAGRTGQLNLRRYDENMSLHGDLLGPGHDPDLPHHAVTDWRQRPGRAVLHLLQVETGEHLDLTAELTEAPLDLRGATGIDSGVWLVQGSFDGRTQRPVAWMASREESATQPTRRSQRIAAYREAFQRQGHEGTADHLWQPLLRLILSARDGGDPAMLDQFAALARSPLAVARMLFVLSEADLRSLMTLDSEWSLFWPALPLNDLLHVARDCLQGVENRLVLAGLAPSQAGDVARGGVRDRLALLRTLRPDLQGHIAVVLFETGLLAHIGEDKRFQGLLLPQPQAALDEAIQSIARSDPVFPWGIEGLRPEILPMPKRGFQRTVEMAVATVLAVAEQAVGLRKSVLTPDALFEAALIEVAIPGLFDRALLPSLLIAFAAKSH